MEVRSQLHAPASLPPWKEPLTQTLSGRKMFLMLTLKISVDKTLKNLAVHFLQLSKYIGWFFAKEITEFCYSSKIYSDKDKRKCGKDGCKLVTFLYEIHLYRTLTSRETQIVIR
jgi:hypothetical protein